MSVENIGKQQILYTVNYEKAIQNMNDILINEKIAQAMYSNIFDAIDIDNEGTLSCERVESFVLEFLKGTQKEGEINTDSSMEHEETFKILRENEQGEVTQQELGEFLQVLLKNQIKVL